MFNVEMVLHIGQVPMLVFNNRQIVYLTWKEFTLLQNTIANKYRYYIYITTLYSHEQASTKLYQYKLALHGIGLVYGYFSVLVEH